MFAMILCLVGGGVIVGCFVIEGILALFETME